MKKILKTEETMLILAVVFVVGIVVFNFYDYKVDKTAMYAHPISQVAEFEVELININKADIQQLCTLPGVKESTARKIIEYRTENNGFSSIEEILNVSGIGYQGYIRLLPLITV